jgi:hypothetical protein
MQRREMGVSLARDLLGLDANAPVRSSGAMSQESLEQQLQQQAPFAPYVTSSSKETLVTNYKSVIGMSVIEW